MYTFARATLMLDVLVVGFHETVYPGGEWFTEACEDTCVTRVLSLAKKVKAIRGGLSTRKTGNWIPKLIRKLHTR